MSCMHLAGIQSHHRTVVLASFFVWLSYRYFFKNTLRETLQLFVLGAKHRYFLITE